MTKEYLLDGEPVTMSELTRAAELEGYKGFGGFFLTSEAARVLRVNGHTVERNIKESSPREGGSK